MHHPTLPIMLNGVFLLDLPVNVFQNVSCHVGGVTTVACSSRHRQNESFIYKTSVGHSDSLIDGGETLGGSGVQGSATHGEKTHTYTHTVPGSHDARVHRQQMRDNQVSFPQFPSGPYSVCLMRDEHGDRFSQ